MNEMTNKKIRNIEALRKCQPSYFWRRKMKGLESFSHDEQAEIRILLLNYVHNMKSKEQVTEVTKETLENSDPVPF
jgi:hypothetical protein